MITGTMVLEGGATRGVFTSGALDYLMEKDVYLSHVIDAIRGLYEEKLHNLHTRFQIASHTDLLLKGDADRLIEVLQNLLENAIKYGDGKCISIDFS